MMNNQVQIKLTDNGKGLPGDLDKNDISSLGLQLINVLSKQMNAKYAYDSSPKGGTVFTIQFEKVQSRESGTLI